MHTPRLLSYHRSTLAAWALGLVAAAVLAAAPTTCPADTGAPPAPVDPAIANLLDQARAAVSAGHLDEAERDYQDVLRRDKTCLQAMLELSTVYERTGRLEYARGLLIRATRIDPHYDAIVKRRRAVEKQLVQQLTTEVDSLLAVGAYQQAMPRLSLNLTIDPDNPSLRYKKALCLYEMGRYDAAMSEVETAIAAEPVEAYFVLRDRIVVERKRQDVKRMVTHARRLATSHNPVERSEATMLVNRILAADSSNQWARKEQQRLAAEAPVDSTRDETGAVAGRVLAVWNTAGRLAQAVGQAIFDHLLALVILGVAWLAFRSPAGPALVRRLRRTPLLAGDLSRFPLTEVLLLLNAEPHTGVLEVNAPTCTGRVFFMEGEPFHCSVDRLEGIKALNRLIDDGQSGRFAFHNGTPPSRHTIEKPLSLILAQRAAVAARPARRVAKKSRMKELLETRSDV